MSFVAHVRCNGDQQTLCDHLRGVAERASASAQKLDLSAVGEVLGLLHDLGKYSEAFQNYLKSVVGIYDQDADDEYVDAKSLKGKIDHSSAGAQLVWQRLSNQGATGAWAGQILALCIASHHSGLIDCLSPAGDNVFGKRINKSAERTFLHEALTNADSDILKRADQLLQPALIQAIQSRLAQIVRSRSCQGNNIISQQQVGLLVRFLFSCLIDADRADTADFEKPRAGRQRPNGRYTDWPTLITRLETHLALLRQKTPIDGLRAEIARHCLDGAKRRRGLFTLTVPTGGGKTLASLRFALNHAKEWEMDRIIYAIPFTSIIDQNAEVVRQVLEAAGTGSERDRIVLEHHGNLTPEQQGWREKMLAENWDAPVIYTTNVQILEALFGSGTRGARHMHQLANAVIVFDEIQTLPINCVHLFNNAVNFLIEQCGSTVVLCTATQPLLDRVDYAQGCLNITPESELMPDVGDLFDKLKRVEVLNDYKPGGWSNQEIAELALHETRRADSCLVIVNTKASAQAIYQLCQAQRGLAIAHLSTSMCPAHRKRILKIVRHRLKWQKPTLCVSTQLIEAGVDVDFGAVIRFAAGLDSIAQAAGRCNRNGLRATGVVHIVNPADENLSALRDIRIGRDKAERVLDDYEKAPEKYGCNRIGPEAMRWYYENYFFARAHEMAYPLSASEFERDDSILNLLSANQYATHEYCMRHGGQSAMHLRQAFMSAANAFKAIDAPTRGIIVPFGKEGEALVADLCAAFEVEKQFDLLKRAQQYTVNVFPNVLAALIKAEAIFPVQDGVDILYLDSRYYSPEFGLVTEPIQPMEVLIS